MNLQAPDLALTYGRVLSPASCSSDSCGTSQHRPAAAGRPGTVPVMFWAAPGVRLLTWTQLVSSHVIPRTEPVFALAYTDPRGDCGVGPSPEVSWLPLPSPKDRASWVVLRFGVARGSRLHQEQRCHPSHREWVLLSQQCPVFPAPRSAEW